MGGSDEGIGMNQPGPSKAKRITTIVVFLLIIVGSVIFAAWARSFGSIIFAAFVTLLLPAALVRSWKVGEAETIRRQDEAMKIKDDPHEMARWVP